MKNIFIVFICLFGLSTTAQISFVGFSSPNCSTIMTNVYTFTNVTSGSGSGTWHGFAIYRNGQVVFQDGGSMTGSMFGKELIFINDSTGFFAYRFAGGGTQLIKTSNYGATWNSVGAGAPDYLGLYIVNFNFAYLVTTYNNFVLVTKCSDVIPSQWNFIIDNDINSDKHVMDTVLNHTLCSIDSLNIFIKNNSDTITYHINKFIPIIGQSVITDNCVGDSIRVPFEIGSQFNTGNTFTAQLSDSAGLFINPINIGSLSSTTSGTISAVIPSTMSIGSNYKIRVTSSDPYYTGTDNGAMIHIYNSGPIFSFFGTNVCEGSSVTLSVLGATSYTWSNGGVNVPVNVLPTVTTTYSITGENSCGISTGTVNVTVDTTCQNVWPGDINSDRYVNNLDVLELGLHINMTGPQRAVVSNNWQSYFANNWTGTISNGKNLNHSDCNGDGFINNDDTLAIYDNYNFQHVFKEHSQLITVNPTLKIVPDQDTVYKGSWGSASIYIGDSLNPVNSINGLAYTINHYLDPFMDSTYIEYPVSFFNSSNQNLHFSKKLNYSNNVDICAAITHTNNINASGYGKIAKVHYKIKPSISFNETANITLGNAYFSNASGVITPISSNYITIVALAVGIKEISSEYEFSFMPNPTNGIVTITSKYNFEKIELSGVTGQVLLSETVNDKTHQLQLRNFAEGIYFIKVVYANGMSVTKKVIVNH